MQTNNTVANAEMGEAKVSLTEMEAKILNACLNYDDILSQLSDNYSNCDLKDAHAICGGKHRSAGVIGSLCKKGLIFDPMSDENFVIWMTDEGVKTIFAYNKGNK